MLLPFHNVYNKMHSKTIFFQVIGNFEANNVSSNIAALAVEIFRAQQITQSKRTNLAIVCVKKLTC